MRIENLPENKIFRGLFFKKHKKYFCFVKKQKNALINVLSKKTITSNLFQLDTIYKPQQYCNYFHKLYKSNTFEVKEEYFSPEFIASFSALRFFNLKYEQLFDIKNKNKIIKKWTKFTRKYLPKKTLRAITKELKNCNCIRTILSYWPIEISQRKPWAVHNETTFRYLENLRYFNLFNISEILIANFEGENVQLMKKLYPIWSDLILQKKNEAIDILNKEEKDALNNNDEPVVKEIAIIKKIIDEETTNIEFSSFTTPNSLFKFWPTILYPAPEAAKPS